MRFGFLALGALSVVSVGCAALENGGSATSLLKPDEYVNPPAAQMARPGPMVDGPGPGVLGMVAHTPGHGMMPGMPAETTQVKFTGQPGMAVGWRLPHGWAEEQMMSGASYDFVQNAVYQLKFSGFTAQGYENLQLYPTLEIRGTDPATRTYLDHSVVPVEVTEEDLEYVTHNNMVTKVIYLPDEKNQAHAIAGVETLISTELAPGVDPVQQAEQRGTIMVILRFGNINLQLPTTTMTANGPVQQVSHSVMSGRDEQYAPPMPISVLPPKVHGVPGSLIAAGAGMPGQPVVPVSGMGPTPPWGMTSVGTPIGLPGPPHLPLGRPAGLRSHTVRNLSDNRIPEPTRDLLVDVRHNPGINVPPPVRHIEYTETHPVHAPGELSHPAGSGAPGAGQCRF